MFWRIKILSEMQLILDLFKLKSTTLRSLIHVKTAKIKHLERLNILDHLYSRRMNLENEDGTNESKEVSLQEIDEFFAS